MLGVAQIRVGLDKSANIALARSALEEARAKGADMVVLPEVWNSPYSASSFPVYAEELPAVGGLPSEDAPSARMLCEAARATGLWVIGGSIPERDGDHLYNTSLAVDPTGAVVAKHRKMHLFDINIPGKMVFRESDTLSAGSAVTTVDTPWGRVGVGICYDIRFPELATVMRQRGCSLLVYPGAFNMTTGPLHWELLQRARAVDNNVFVATCSPARTSGGKGYVAYAHSSVVDPMGNVLLDLGAQEGVDAVGVCTLDMRLVAEMRDQIPCWKQKRDDLYCTLDRA
jgi:omega-amidase